MKSTYNSQEIESKWREIWDKNKTFQVDLNLSSDSKGKAKKPYYNLMMFPYPSAEGLHVGNMYAFTGSDIWGRYMKMKGYDVFEPIGLDGFGIHSENYALKVNKHPAEQAKISEKNFYRQLKMIGNQFSWDNKLETYDPDYYKWTQWIFIQMFKAGLAYRAKSAVNWCPSCKTVLADEQVINEKCERCGSKVKKRDLEQWFFKITKYADRLLNNLKKIDWTEKVKIAQRHWIGRKEGINITYEVVESPKNTSEVTHHKNIDESVSCEVKKSDDVRNQKKPLTITCFTTRPDTNFGATFIVLAPEHPLVYQITSKDSKKAVGSYIKQALKKSKAERIAEGQGKTGVFTGAYCINQLTGKHMPVWVSDFVLMEVGTGAVVGVPGHDLRDFDFAKKFDLPIIRVVVGLDGDQSKITKASQVYEGEGIIVNSGCLHGLTTKQAKKKIMDDMEKKGWGKTTTSYHLRDWLISRQRYWGPPIPMIYCQKCGWHPVPEKDLPVLLPQVKDWRPKGTGRGPLSQLKDWVNVKCPKCGGPAKRETDVSDTFLDSAWYFLRYPSVGQNPVFQRSAGLRRKSEDERQTGFLADKAWDKNITKRWLPVNMYIGGAEHSVLHLLYSRFLTMVFKDLGLLDFDEPFTKFRAHGLIIKDGAKMSKSKGNIVNPDDYIEKYGADTLRCYLMFLGPFRHGGDFRDTGMKGMYKFLAKVYKLCQKQPKKHLGGDASPAWQGADGSCEVEGKKEARGSSDGGTEREDLYWQHKTIKKVTDSISRLKYNTAISSLMEYVNYLSQSQKTLILLLAPFAPYLSEELWQKAGSASGDKNTSEVTQAKSLLRGDPKHEVSRVSSDGGTKREEFNSVHNQPWPKYNPKYIKQDKIEIVIQVNGKLKDKIFIKAKNTSEVTHHKNINKSGSCEVEGKKEIINLALKSLKIQKHLKGKKIKKTIYIKGRLINFVV